MNEAAANASRPRPEGGSNALDIEAIRGDFPILRRSVYGRPLVYLDNAASAQKPRRVIDCMRDVMEGEYANVHRGVHFLSQAATDKYEGVRDKVARLLNAARPEEIVYTRNATDAINLVAGSYGRAFLKEGDEVVLSAMEHHANIVPWQLLRGTHGIVLKIVPIDDAGNFLLDEYEALLGPRTKLVAVTHASNALGTITPAKEIVRLAHDRGIPVLLDGSQAVVHSRVDVQDLDVDFYVFTGHKLYGPTGIGILYAKAEHLERMPPYQGGGDMIREVTFEKTTFADPPHRFEAGTPPIVEAIALGAAVDYVESIGIENVAAYEHQLLQYATQRLSMIKGVRIFGTADEKCSILSFVMDSAHSHDVGTVLDRAGLAVRAGHHCAQPLMDRLGVAATVRASFGMYNTRDEVDALAAAVESVRELFG